jgi:hypothetical protein
MNSVALYFKVLYEGFIGLGLVEFLSGFEASVKVFR